MLFKNLVDSRYICFMSMATDRKFSDLVCNIYTYVYKILFRFHFEISNSLVMYFYKYIVDFTFKGEKILTLNTRIRSSKVITVKTMLFYINGNTTG